MLYLSLALVLAVMAIWKWKAYQKSKKKAGITGWVNTQDLDGRSTRIYRDEEAGFSCKPDVVESRKVIEYKSAAAKGRPRWVDMLQVALQMKATGKKEGELRYGNNQNFRFSERDSEMRAATRKALRIVELMRDHLRRGVPPKATPSARKCAKCPFQNLCPEAVR